MENFKTWHQIQVVFVRMNHNAGEWGYCDIDMPDGSRCAVHEGHLSAAKVGPPEVQL